MIDDREVLQAGFAEFVAVARELERSYDELKARVAAVDLQLQASNRALQQSLAEREAMFTALPIGVVALRGDGSVGAENKEATRLCAAAVAHGVDLVRHAGGEVGFGEHVVRVRRVDLPDGELVLLEDRSRLEELEREVRRLDRLAGLSELALGVAHEIKNPLNGVMGFAALLQRSDDAFAMRRFAGKIVAGVEAVDGIVKALLGFARPSDKPLRAATLRSIVDAAARAANLPQARLQLSGATDAMVDADALGRVLDNLIRNAIEACPAATVRIRAAERHGTVELLFEDDGPGVPAAVGQRVFEPFLSTKERGTGLGLPLSARVLSFLGGSLELLNPGEAGARFRVRLPLVRGAACAAEAAS